MSLDTKEIKELLYAYILALDDNVLISDHREALDLQAIKENRDRKELEVLLEHPDNLATKDQL